MKTHNFIKWKIATILISACITSPSYGFFFKREVVRSTDDLSSTHKTRKSRGQSSDFEFLNYDKLIAGFSTTPERSCMREAISKLAEDRPLWSCLTKGVCDLTAISQQGSPYGLLLVSRINDLTEVLSRTFGRAEFLTLKEDHLIYKVSTDQESDVLIGVGAALLDRDDTNYDSYSRVDMGNYYLYKRRPLVYPSGSLYYREQKENGKPCTYWSSKSCKHAPYGYHVSVMYYSMSEHQAGSLSYDIFAYLFGHMQTFGLTNEDLYTPLGNKRSGFVECKMELLDGPKVIFKTFNPSTQTNIAIPNSISPINNNPIKFLAPIN